MPLLTGPVEIAAHVNAALDAGDRWVFLTDNRPGRDQIAWLAVALRGMGVGPGQLFTSRFEFKNLPTRHAGVLTLFTCPMGVLPACVVESLVTAFSGRPCPALTPADALILLARESDRDGDLFHFFIESCRTGLLFDAVEPGTSIN